MRIVSVRSRHTVFAIRLRCPSSTAAQPNTSPLCMVFSLGSPAGPLAITWLTLPDETT